MKKPLEFFQKLVLIAFTLSIVVVIAVLAADFILLWNEKPAMPEEAVAAITTYGGITSGISAAAYAALTAVRSHSQNKYVNNREDENHEN